jgi:hypothetical protein
MVESIGVSPGWQPFFSKRHERSLKAWYRLCAFGISRGYHAPLAWIVAKEGDIADSKRLKLIRWSKELIFPKRINSSQLKIGPKPPTHAFEIQFRKPMSHLLEACFTGNCGT